MTLHVVPTIPRGIGVFLRRQPEALDAKAISKRCVLARAARVRWAAHLLDAPDGWRATYSKLAAWSSAYRDEAGAESWLWSFPGRDALDDPATWSAHLAHALDATHATGLILDLEAPCKNRPGDTAAITELAARVLHGRALGITSYPIAAWHREMPWSVLARGDFGMPQLYESAKDSKIARRAIGEWTARWSRAFPLVGDPRPCVPVLAAYPTASPGDGADQLRGDLDRCLLGDDDKPIVSACAIWSDPQLDTAERGVLADFARTHGW